MKDPWMQQDPWILHFKTNLTGGRDEQIAVPFEEAHAPDTLRKCLWGQGITFGQEAKAIGEFMTSWIQKLQSTKGLVVSSAPFGWIEKGGKLEGFCYGDNVWTPTGNRPAASTDHVLAKQYRPCGDMQPWVDAALLVTSQGRSDLDAVVASSFGAPLVRFTGMTGLLMSIYSMESGIGKSTALKVAQSVWGNPITAMQGLSDTSNSVINKIGEIKSLPLYWDELKTEDDTRRFVNLAFQLSLGKEKSRLRADASQRDPGTWQTIMVSASNESLLDFVLSRTKMTTAGLFRVFEYVVMKPTASVTMGLAKAQSILGQLHGNYGNVGLEYAKFLGSNFIRVESETQKYFDDVLKECGGTPDERFWFALVTCICMGAKYANELGFTSFNEAALKKFMISSLTGMRRERNSQPVDMDKTENVSNILAQFLNAMRGRHTLFTNRIHISAGKPHKGSIQVKRDATKMDGVYVQVGLDDKLIRMSSFKMSEWCREKEVSRHMFTKALEKEFGTKLVHGRLGGGTDFGTGATEYLIEINLAGLNASKFIDGE
jgi:regulator of sigma D